MLPQRRKSAEEIAKLRESMGIPGSSVVPEEPVPETTDLFTPPADEEELPPPPPPKQVRSLRKSEQGPVERRPVARTPVPKAAAIPVRKHTEKEIATLRAQSATPPDHSIHYLLQLTAPKSMIVALYAGPLLGASAGGLSKWAPTLTPSDFPMEWMAQLSRNPATPSIGLGILVATCAVSLLMSAWIAVKKPRSRHHAGFATILAVLVLTFGIIYHLPTPHGP